MRALELVLLVALAVRLGAILGRGPRGAAWRSLGAVAVGGAFVAHLALEGPRWTMLPAYAAAIVFVVLMVNERPHPETPKLRLGRNRRRRDPLPWGRFVLGAVVVSLGVAASWALPVPRLPAPTGPWAVGGTSVVLDLVDDEGAPVGAGGRTMVRLWYPVDPDLELPNDAPWLERDDVMPAAMALSGGLPAWTFDHLRFVRTHTAWGAPLAEPPDGSGWPLVAFEHGFGGFRSQNTFLAEELASHGRVVMAVEHPGGAILTVLPDGTERPYVPLPPRYDSGYGEAVVDLAQRWTDETLAALDALADGSFETDGAGFTGALDLGRVVSVGHSTGGPVAVEVCHALEGCPLAIALDGWWHPLPTERARQGLERPLVSIASDPAVGYFAPSNRSRFESLVDGASVPVLDLVLRGAGHHDLNDTNLLSPIADRFGHSTGPIPARRAHAIVRRVVLAALEGDVLAAAEAVTDRWLVPGPTAFDAP